MLNITYVIGMVKLYDFSRNETRGANQSNPIIITGFFNHISWYSMQLLCLICSYGKDAYLLDPMGQYGNDICRDLYTVSLYTFENERIGVILR